MCSSRITRRARSSDFGLGHDDLAALNPGLIYCSISGYGRTGPRAEEPGYDFAIQAESGLMSITGEPKGAPMKHGMAITDLVTGMNAAQAVLAALIARSRTGKGQFIDMALLDCGIALLANMASGHIVTGDEPPRLGNAHPSLAPYQLFETADGDFVLAIGNDGQFRALCERVIGRPELVADPRFATSRDRVLNRDVLIPELIEIFRKRPTAEWIAALQREKVPCGQVRNLKQVFASPEVAARGLVAEVPDARHGKVKLMRSALALRGTPPREPSAPPRLAEHTDALFARCLASTPRRSRPYARQARWLRHVSSSGRGQRGHKRVERGIGNRAFRSYHADRPRGDASSQTGSQAKTSPERSSGTREALKAPGS